MLHRVWNKRPRVCDLRVSRRGIQCRTHRFTATGRGHLLAAMGSTYQGRYGHIPGIVPPLERVFQWAMHSMVYSRNIALHVNPKYALAFRWIQEAKHVHLSRERILERVFRSQLSAERHEPIRQVFSLVNRLTEQHRRIDDVRRHASVPSMMATPERERERSRIETAQKLVPRAVEMVLKRDAVAVQAVRQDTAQVAGSDQSRCPADINRSSTQAPRPFSFAECSPNELQRLTDQVVTRLDHRVIALRERLGRV